MFSWRSFVYECKRPRSTRIVHERSTDYEWPTDQQVLDKLDKWQDQKFGVLFHWGLYSVPGIVEFMVYLFRGCRLDFP